MPDVLLVDLLGVVNENHVHDEAHEAEHDEQHILGRSAACNRKSFRFRALQSLNREGNVLIPSIVIVATLQAYIATIIMLLSVDSMANGRMRTLCLNENRQVTAMI